MCQKSMGPHLELENKIYIYIRLRMAIRASGPKNIIVNFCVFQNKQYKETACSEGDSPL